MLRREEISRGLVLSLLVALPGVFLALFFVWPLTRMLWLGLMGADLGQSPGATPDSGGLWSDSALWGMLLRARTWRVMADTLVLALAGTFGSVLFGVGGAWVLYGLHFPGRNLCRSLTAVPFVLPSVVVGVAFQNLFAEGGWLGFLGWDASEGGLRAVIVLGMVFFNFALVSRIVGHAWVRLDPRPVWAARALGATPAQAFYTVTLPRLLPAIGAAASLVFLYCLTAYGLVRVLGGVQVTTLEVEIYLETATYLNLPGAAALSLLQLVVVALALVINSRSRSLAHRGGVVPSQSGRRPRVEDALSVVLSVLGLGLVLLPLAALVVKSLHRAGEWTLDNYLNLSRPGLVPALPGSVWQTAGYSLQVAFLSTLISLLCAVAVAVVVSRPLPPGSPWLRAQEGFDLLFSSPQGVSAVTVGFGMLITLQAPPLSWEANALFLAAAQSVVAVPLVLRAILPTIRALDPRQLQVAATLGASPIQVWRTVEWPVLRRVLGVGAGFAFAISLGEFGATSFLARPLDPTLPLAIFALSGRPSLEAQGAAAAAAVVLAALCAIAMAGAEWYAQRDKLSR